MHESLIYDSSITFIHSSFKTKEPYTYVENMIARYLPTTPVLQFFTFSTGYQSGSEELNMACVQG